MKKKLFLVVSVALLSLLTALSACGSPNTPPYSLRPGTYNFEIATITDLHTKVGMVKSFDDILNDKTLYKAWRVLFDFSVVIDEETEYIYKSDDRCFVLNEGLAYEVIGENKLKLHFPRFGGYDYNNYDIVIILRWAQSYL